MSVDTGAPGSVLHANEATFSEVVLQSQVPVLVDFYADWCVPCQMFAPTLERFARATPDVKVVKVNVDDNPRLASQYGIRSIPNLLVFRDVPLPPRKREWPARGNSAA